MHSIRLARLARLANLALFANLAPINYVQKPIQNNLEILKRYARKIRTNVRNVCYNKYTFDARTVFSREIFQCYTKR